MSPFVRVTLAILRKDLRRELHTKETVSSMFVFAVLVVVVFNFTLALDEVRALELGPGILWTAFVFAATLGLNRSFASERENESLSGLIMAPVDRSAIYFGKLGSNLLFMLVMEAFVLPVFVVFFNLNVSEILPVPISPGSRSFSCSAPPASPRLERSSRQSPRRRRCGTSYCRSFS